jgi:cystathionine gamma-synthase
LGDHGSVESWLVSAGRDRRPGSPLNVPPIPASNFVLGEHRACSRDDGTPGWEAWKRSAAASKAAHAMLAGAAARSDDEAS